MLNFAGELWVMHIVVSQWNLFWCYISLHCYCSYLSINIMFIIEHSLTCWEITNLIFHIKVIAMQIPVN